MIATALIVFREIFELALVVGIVMAATYGLAGRGRWIVAGLAGGVCGAGLVAVFAGTIAGAVQGMGQELLNAAVLLLAVGMLGWHNVWMSSHGRELAKAMDAVGHAVASGARPLYALAIVVGLAALREGSEIVLFLWGIAAASAQGGALSMLAGGVLGLLGGSLVGLALYRGLLRIPQRYVFSVTSWMILLLAAGMASQGAGFLVQAGWLPPVGEPVWDTSWLLEDNSPIGRVLHTLVGYTARPDGMQLLFYFVTLLGIGLLMKWLGAVKPGSAARTAAAVAVGLGLVSAGNPARADDKIFYPQVTAGEAELEYMTFHDHYDSATTPDLRNTTVELAYGVTDWWKTELEVEYEQGQGEPGGYRHSTSAIENVFLLAPQGTYRMDLGLFAEAELAAHPDQDPNEFFLGPLLSTQTGPWLHTLNVILHAEAGTGASNATDLRYGWQSRWLLSRKFQPALEIFGQPGDVSNFAPQSEQILQAGPVIVGLIFLGRGYNLKYHVGQLYGLTHASPDQTNKLLLELEHVF